MLTQLKYIAFLGAILFLFSCKNKKTCNEKVIITDTTYKASYTFEKDTGYITITWPHFEGLCDTNIRNDHNYFFTEYVVKPNIPDTNTQLVNITLNYVKEFENEDMLIISTIRKKTYLDAIVPSYSYNKNSYIFEPGSKSISGIHNCFTKPQDIFTLLKTKLFASNSTLDTSKIILDQIRCLPKDQNILFYCNLEETNRLYAITDSINPIAEALIPVAELKQFINPYGPFKNKAH